MTAPSPSTELTDSTWPAVPVRPVVLVPLGSTEQHGPHLPLDTDTVVATAVARAAATRLDGPVLVAPAFPYGASSEHQAFPGTASIGERALVAALSELVRSLATWAARVVLINGHGGNLRAVATAVAQLRDDGLPVGWMLCGMHDRQGHAGRAETSLMLHLAPSRVRIDRAEAGNTVPIDDLLLRLAAHGVRAVSANGVLGDPSGASAAEGAELMAQIVDDCLHRVTTDNPDLLGMLVR